MYEVLSGKIEKSGSIRFSLAAASRFFLKRGMSISFRTPNSIRLHSDGSGDGSIFKKGYSFCAQTKKMFDQFGIQYQTGMVEVRFYASHAVRIDDYLQLPIKYFLPNGTEITCVEPPPKTPPAISEPSLLQLGPDRGENADLPLLSKGRPSEQLHFGFAPEIRTFIDAEGSLRFSPELAKSLRLDQRSKDKDVFVSVYFPRGPLSAFPIELIVHSKFVPGSYPVFRKGKIHCIQLASTLDYMNSFDFRKIKAFLKLDDKCKHTFQDRRVYRLLIEEYEERVGK